MKPGKVPCNRCRSTRYRKINADGICIGCETALKLHDQESAKAANDKANEESHSENQRPFLK